MEATPLALEVNTYKYTCTCMYTQCTKSRLFKNKKLVVDTSILKERIKTCSYTPVHVHEHMIILLYIISSSSSQRFNVQQVATVGMKFIHMVLYTDLHVLCTNMTKDTSRNIHNLIIYYYYYYATIVLSLHSNDHINKLAKQNMCWKSCTA